MIYYMDSKEFTHKYLANESDQDILDTQYILVSSRLRTTGKWENSISAYSTLFPEAEVLDAWYLKNGVWEEFYIAQLDSNVTFLATTIRGVIERDYNVVLLNSHKERKVFDYISFIADYIYSVFGYPVYNYSDYIKGKYKLIPYDKAKVYKICRDIMKETKESGILKELHNPAYREDAIKRLKKDSKYMKKLLKKNGLYSKGLSKDEMIDLMFYIEYDEL